MLVCINVQSKAVLRVNPILTPARQVRNNVYIQLHRAQSSYSSLSSRTGKKMVVYDFSVVGQNYRQTN